MARPFKDIDKDKLIELALEYCDECIENTKEVTAQYKVVEVRDRHIPTVGYFINHWLRRKHFDFYCMTYWFDVMRDEEHPLSECIKSIDKMFKDLAEDIVANEGKGIFYAKNRLKFGDNGLKAPDRDWETLICTLHRKYLYPH